MEASLDGHPAMKEESRIISSNDVPGGSQEGIPIGYALDAIARKYIHLYGSSKEFICLYGT
jgi:hypothetical protein